MKRRLRVLLISILAVTAMFASSMNVYAFVIENTPDETMFRVGNTVSLNCQLNSDVGTAYVYVDFSDNEEDKGKIWILKDDSVPDGYNNNYFVNNIKTGYNCGGRHVVSPYMNKTIVDEGTYQNMGCATTYKIVKNDFYVNPTPSGGTPSVEQNDETPSMSAEQIEEQRAEELQKAFEETIAAEEALPITEFTSESAVNSIPAAAKSTGASANLSKITTMQGFSSAVTKLAATAKASITNRNGVASVTVYTDKPMTFSTDMLDAIYAADVNFSYAFRYEGKLYMITIPSEVKVDLGESRYEGPLFVGKLLGTTQVIE